MKQRGRYPARDGHPPYRVAERRNALRQSAAQLFGGQRMTDAATGPERRAVVAPGVAFAALVAVRAAPGVDDVRVHGADVFDVELVLLPLRRHVVGQEDVGGLGDLVEPFLTARRRHVDTDASLTAIGML